MNLRRILAIFASLAVVGSFAGGCQSGGVGDPCIPEDEYQTSFSGFAAEELNIESRSFQCETRVCLVNHFRGRVSCPLGMNEETFAKLQSGAISPDDATVCRLPGESGKKAVTVATTVNPQCDARRADRAVYCSCRCGGSDPNAKYCDCPSGYDCTDLSEFALGAAVAQGSAQLSGKYCLKAGTQVQPGQDICKAGTTVDQTQAAAGSCTSKGNCKDSDQKPITVNP